MFIKQLLGTRSRTKYLRQSRKQRNWPSSHEANILEINYNFPERMISY